MLSKSYIYVADKAFHNMFFIPHDYLRIFQKIFITTTMETAEYWPMARANMAFGMPLLPPFSFGQKILTQSP